jgi:hypothetical protein
MRAALFDREVDMQDGTLSAAPRYSAIVEPGRFPEAWSTGHLSAVARWLLDWAADDDARWREALEAPEALSPERSKLEKITPENFYQYVGVCASFMLEDADFWREHDALAPTLAARGELLKHALHVHAREHTAPRAGHRAHPR